MKNIWYIFFFITLCSCGIQKKESVATKLPLTIVHVVQDNNDITVQKNGATIRLKAAPFKLVFYSENTEAVFLHASLNSASYDKVIDKKFNSLKCFSPPSTFAEPAKNDQKELYVVEEEERGYHCLFARSEDEQFIRLDSVKYLSDNKWVGVRTVNRVSLITLYSSETLSCESLSGKTIYITYSPEQVLMGYCFKISFE